MPAKKRELIKFYCADGDPMMAAEGKIYAEKVFFEKWQECLDGDANWDFKMMKQKMAEKPENERWFVMKSVETFPAEDDSVPFVPNFIIFSMALGDDSTCQAPRLCMKAAQKTPDMDEEAYMSEDIIDMKETHEWRSLENYKNIFVICGKMEDTLKIKELGFGGGGGFPASTGGSSGFNFGTGDAAAKTDFSFGAPASGNTGFNFGAAAPAGTGFSFTPVEEKKEDPPASKKRPREDDEEPADDAAKKFKNEAGDATPSPVVMATPQPGFSFGSGSTDFSGFGTQEATRFIEETVYPVLFTPDMVEDIRKEITAGMKIITVYADSESDFKIKLKIDCDLDFAKKVKEGKYVPTIRGLIEKKVLEGSQAFRDLREKYQGDDVAYNGVEEHESMQNEFRAKRAAMLQTDEIKKQVREIEKTHMKDIMAHLRPILKARVDRVEHMRALLTAINKEIKEGLMVNRQGVKVLRILPEKDSKGAHCAFRPCKKINKAVGAADVCYPEEVVQINPLTGKPMPGTGFG